MFYVGPALALDSLGSFGLDKTTGNTDCAKQAGQAGKGTFTLKIVAVPGHVPAWMNGDIGGIGCQQISNFLDLGCRDIAFLCSLIQSPFLNTCLELVKTFPVLFNKFFVILTGLYQVIHHGQQHGSIGTRFDLNPDIRFAGRG